MCKYLFVFFFRNLEVFIYITMYFLYMYCTGIPRILVLLEEEMLL